MELIYRTKTGFKVGCWIMAVLCFVLVVLAPFGVLMLWLGHGAYVRITDDTLEVRWIGKRFVKWSDITGLRWMRAAGLIGAMMRPLGYDLKDGSKWSQPRIAVGVFERTEELLAELQKRSGQKITL